MRIRVLAIALASTAVAVASLATAQPTVSKPDEVQLPVAGTPVTRPVVQVTSQRFGTLKTGKKLTQAMLKKVFPKAKVTWKKATKTWRVEDAAAKLVVVADATKIVVDSGPVEAHGVAVGDAGQELHAGIFASAHCTTEKGDSSTVTCNKDSLAIRLAGCTSQAAADGTIKAADLRNCKVQQLTWFAYTAP